MTLCDGGGVGRALRVTPKKYFICIISYYNLYYCVCFINRFSICNRVCFINRFSICRADRRALRYGGGGRAGVTLCDRGGQNWPKKALRNS